MNCRRVPAVVLAFSTLVACATAAERPTARSSNSTDAEAIAAAEESSTKTDGTDGPSDDSTDIISGPADPIALTVATDDTLAVSAAIVAADGGQITAAGPDGSTFTLSIPANVLSVDTTITMTPLASVSGLPWGDDGAIGVQLAPNGLTFPDFVTLTVEPATPLPIDQQLPFGYGGEANQLVLALVDPKSEAIALKLLHFSGWGVSKGLLADVGPVRQRLGGSDEARIESAFAAELAAERQRQFLGSGEEDSQVDWAKYFQELEDKVVKPRVAVAGQSCANGRLAVESVLGLERKKQLLGFGAKDMTEIIDLIDTAGLVCVKEEYELCRDDHIVHRMVPIGLGLSRQFQLLGGGTDFPSVAAARDLAVKCLTFELVLTSTVVLDTEGDGYTSTVESTVKLKFDPDTLKMSGSSPLINTSFDMYLDGCSVTSNRGGGTFEVDSLVYVPAELPANAKPNDPGTVKDITLTYYPGSTSESASITCDAFPLEVPPSPLWFAGYVVAHTDELDMVGGAAPPINPIDIFNGEGPDLTTAFGPRGAGFVATEWEIIGDALYATKEWQIEVAELGVVEVGTFKLHHKPG